MIDLVVSLNGEDFEVRAAGDVYNNELPDFNAAVRSALHAQFLAHPLDPLDSASLEVGIRRVHQDVAARDGVFDDPESPRSDLANERAAEEDPDSLSEAELEARTAPDEPKAGRRRRSSRRNADADASSSAETRQDADRDAAENSADNE